MAPTPSQRAITSYQTPSKNPPTKHRLLFPNPRSGSNPHPSPNPLSSAPTEHPVEVIGRIRDHPDRKDKTSSSSVLEISGDGRTVRVRSDVGYRDFSLDGVSHSENEDLEAFYKRFVESRIEGVRSGAKCTIMMYGPTGAGKSHTMFGCARQPGIVYRALRDILGDGDMEGGLDDAGFRLTLFVQVAVLEIYNEEIYDLLSGGNSNGSGSGIALPKGSIPKARLEVIGRKAKNATYMCGNEAGKISREVAKVEKRRIVKSTLCNERSSRSHCLVILDVPSVGGRLMLVDMAGSENIEQAGQAGFEAKMQTAKINQGNTALKRVVESIANGDSHVPFRDSKLTMLLQDSFEDDKSKILMILCASPDPKELHKTIATLEYGAKAKCITRVAHMPTPRDRPHAEDSSSYLRARIVAMNQFIYNLQMENKVKDKECDKAQRALLRKEEELLQLRAKLELIDSRDEAAKEEEVKCLVDEKTRALRTELKKMEERMRQQQAELESLKQQIEDLESNRRTVNEEDALHDLAVGNFLKRLGDQGMEKSMELDMGDQEPVQDVKEIREDTQNSDIHFNLPQRVCLSTVFEREDEGEEDNGQSMEEEEVLVDVDEGCCSSRRNVDSDKLSLLSKHRPEDFARLVSGLDGAKDTALARRTRIQNIFRLCGNHRELAQHVTIPTPPKRRRQDSNIHSSSPLSKEKHLLQATLSENHESSLAASKELLETKESKELKEATTADTLDVYVKWETSKELPGGLLGKFKVVRSSKLCDLRKQIETHLEEENNKQPFSFLLLGDPIGSPVVKEKEAAVSVSKLPVYSNQLNNHLACLRPIRNSAQWEKHMPLRSLENTLQPHEMEV